MGCCSSTKISPISDQQGSQSSGRVTADTAGRHEQSQQSAAVISAKPKSIEGSTRGGPRATTVDDPKAWIVDGLMSEARKSIPAVTRMGFRNSYFDGRATTQDRFKSMKRPAVEKGFLWVDGNFSKSIPKQDYNVNEIVWQRPNEFCKEPQLFVGAINRFDINQGGVGTCWFNAVISPLADVEDIFKQIVAEDAYNVGKEGYDGVFHCQFWRLGQWFDVYIDDVIPTRYEKPWGARCLDQNALWLPLFEKAFTKFFGDYVVIEGGPSPLAFSTITGGLTQTLKTKLGKDEKEEKVISGMELFQRIKRAHAAGLVMTTSMDKEEKGEKGYKTLRGLVSDHCYSITGAATVQCKSKDVNLIRMRNPWGKHEGTAKEPGNGEWTGPWSDGSEEWNNVDKNFINKWNMCVANDGEFWISLDDFLTYYHHVDLCSFAPVFHNNNYAQDPKIKHIFNILGEWKLNKDAKEDSSILEKQKFIVHIPNEGVENDGRHHVIFHLIQEQKFTKKSEKDEESFYSPLLLFKIEDCDLKSEQKWMCTEEITNNPIASNSGDVFYDYLLEPGQYMLVPSYYQSQIKQTVMKGFCVRIFSAISEIPCRELVGRPVIFSHSKAEEYDPQLTLANLDQAISLPGVIDCGVDTYEGKSAVDRQIILEVPQTTVTKNRDGMQSVVIQLMVPITPWIGQESNKSHSICLDVYKIDATVDRGNSVWQSLQDISQIPLYPVDNDGDKKTRYWGYKFEVYKYSLKPGKYVLLPSVYLTNSFGLPFLLRVYSSSATPVTCRNIVGPRHVFLYKAKDEFDRNNLLFALGRTTTMVGEINSGVNGYKTCVKVDQQVILDIGSTGNRSEVHTVVLQLMAPETLWPRLEKKSHSICLDVYKVDIEERRGNDVWQSLNEISQIPLYPNKGGTTTYWGYKYLVYKYTLQSGQYVLLPSVYEPESIGLPFMLQIYSTSSVPLTCTTVQGPRCIFLRSGETTLTYGGTVYQLERKNAQFGEWIKGRNAGGQIGYRESYAINPQYSITVTGQGKHPVLFSLLQEAKEPIASIGCQLFRLDDSSAALPLSYSYFASNWSKELKNIDGKNVTYWTDVEQSQYYLLQPGLYVAVVSPFTPKDEKKYILLTAAPQQLQLNIRPI